MNYEPGVDYELVLQIAKERGFLTPEQLVEIQQDEDVLCDIINQESKTVFTLAWDGGSMGNCGENTIEEWHGLYFFNSEVYGAGPFQTLEEVLDLPEFHFSGTPKPEISSNVVPLPRLLDIARDLVEENGDIVLVNESRYFLDSGRLVRTGRY